MKPENWIESTTLRPKKMKSMVVGIIETTVPAIIPDQSGAPCGVCDLKTPKATVSTRTSSSRPTDADFAEHGVHLAVGGTVPTYRKTVVEALGKQQAVTPDDGGKTNC